jgi:hypothetical protein
LAYRLSPFLLSLDLPLPLENPIRGGSYGEASYTCRSAGRHEAERSEAVLGEEGNLTDVGFRVVCFPREVAPCRAVLRGGGWDEAPSNCRSALREYDPPVGSYRGYGLGFRVVRLPQEVTP